MLGLIIIHKGFVSSKMAKLRLRHQSAEVHKLRTPRLGWVVRGKNTLENEDFGTQSHGGLGWFR